MSSNWEKIQKKIKYTKSSVSVIKTVEIELESNPSSDSLPLTEIESETHASLRILDQIINFPISNPTGTNPNDSEDESHITSSISKEKLGKYIAIDCEMVGVGDQGRDSVLARISIVNFHGHVVLDSYVSPKEPVIDYRTRVSGITPEHLLNCPSFESIQHKVSEIMKDKVIVGHGLENDFKVLLLNHPRKLIRDTSKYPPFRKANRGKTPSLKLLASSILGLEFQKDSHCSIQDAQMALSLYKLHRLEWEKSLSPLSKTLSHSKNRDIPEFELKKKKYNGRKKWNK